MRRNRHRSRNPLFAKRWFSDDVILVSVTWYLRFQLSYRDLAQIMGQLGVSVAHCTILRWVIRYSTELANCWRHLARPVGRSWRCDETYVKVSGRWITSTGRWTKAAARSNRISAGRGTWPPPKRSSARR